MNFYFEKIILHNFASYTHSEVDLVEKGFCLVSGRNLYKKDNAYSNGAGKSKIWDGICFTLTGETIKGVKSGLKNTLVDENDGYTELHFKSDSDSYIIRRIIAPKSDLHIMKNGEDVSGKGIRESEKKLGELLPNLNKELITAIILFGQGMPSAFSKLSPSGRKDLLEKVTNSDFMIEAIKERVLSVATDFSNKQRQVEDDLLVKQTIFNTTTTNINEYNKTLSEAVKPDFEASLKINNQALADINKAIADSYKECGTESANSNALSGKLEVLVNERAEELDKVQTDYNNAIPAGLAKKAELEATIKSLTSEINKISAIKEFCPTCGQKLVGVAKPSTASLEADLANANSELARIKAEFTRLDALLASSKQEIIDRYKKQIEDLRLSVSQSNEKLTAINANIIDLSSRKSSLANEIMRITTEAENWDKNIADIKDKLASAELQKKTLITTLETLNTEKQIILDRVAILKKIDTIVKRDLRGHLLTNIINYINKKAKDFCNIVYGTRDIEVYLDGNALDISYCGKMFDSLSGGEAARIDLVLQLAIRDMLKSYLGLESNIIVLDEVTDYLDKQSCKAVMDLIEQELSSVESVFIVSHHAESLSIPIDTTINVEKTTEGLSRIV